MPGLEEIVFRLGPSCSYRTTNEGTDRSGKAQSGYNTGKCSYSNSHSWRMWSGIWIRRWLQYKGCNHSHICTYACVCLVHNKGRRATYTKTLVYDKLFHTLANLQGPLCEARLTVISSKASKQVGVFLYFRL